MLADTGGHSTNMLYTGEYRDQDTNMDCLRARWYDSATGRFNRTDPCAGNNADSYILIKPYHYKSPRLDIFANQVKNDCNPSDCVVDYQV